MSEYKLVKISVWNYCRPDQIKRIDVTEDGDVFVRLDGKVNLLVETDGVEQAQALAARIAEQANKNEATSQN